MAGVRMPPTPACSPSVFACIQMHLWGAAHPHTVWLSIRSECLECSGFSEGHRPHGAQCICFSAAPLTQPDKTRNNRGSRSTVVEHTVRGAVSLNSCFIYGGKSALKSPHFLEPRSTRDFFHFLFVLLFCFGVFFYLYSYRICSTHTRWSS